MFKCKMQTRTQRNNCYILCWNYEAAAFAICLMAYNQIHIARIYCMFYVPVLRRASGCVRGCINFKFYFQCNFVRWSVAALNQEIIMLSVGKRITILPFCFCFIPERIFFRFLFLFLLFPWHRGERLLYVVKRILFPFRFLITMRSNYIILCRVLAHWMS